MPTNRLTDEEIAALVHVAVNAEGSGLNRALTAVAIAALLAAAPAGRRRGHPAGPTDFRTTVVSVTWRTTASTSR